MVDWVVINYAVQPPRIECQRCGASDVLRLPMSADSLVGISKQWNETHARCTGSVGQKVEGFCSYCGQPCREGDWNVVTGTLEGGDRTTNDEGEWTGWEAEVYLHEKPCMAKAFPALTRGLPRIAVALPKEDKQGWDSREPQYDGTCCEEGKQLRKEYDEAWADRSIFQSEWNQPAIAQAWHTADQLRLHAEKHKGEK